MIQAPAPPDDVGVQLAALADPTRRRIFELIAHAPSTVRAVTDRVPVSQPAVSQHLKVLREAGLAVGTARGASTVYRADRAGLASIRTWLDRFWDDVLDGFVAAAEREDDR
ncbi:MAG: metalloregulator ArsR/SmtB family transcription factor [Actinomycetota bacterium]